MAYTPTVAYTGAASAVQHDWTSLVAQYNYSGGILVSVSLYTGFQNVGGAGGLGWRVRIGAPEWTGTGAVVAGGKYTMRVVVSPGSGSLVQVLQPISDSFSIAQTGSSVLGVTYLRVPDAYLSIASNDDDEPTIDVDLFGVAVPAGPDATPPTTTDDSDGLWHSSAVTVTLSAADNDGGSGMSGGLAKTEYSRDGGETWVEGTAVTYRLEARRRLGRPHPALPLERRRRQPRGGAELRGAHRRPAAAHDGRCALAPQARRRHSPPHSRRQPLRRDRLLGRQGDLVSHGRGGWVKGTLGPRSSGTGLHWIAYYSIDNAGNAEYVRWCSVTISGARDRQDGRCGGLCGASWSAHPDACPGLTRQRRRSVRVGSRR